MGHICKRWVEENKRFRYSSSHSGVSKHIAYDENLWQMSFLQRNKKYLGGYFCVTRWSAQVCPKISFWIICKAKLEKLAPLPWNMYARALIWCKTICILILFHNLYGAQRGMILSENHISFGSKQMLDSSLFEDREHLA